MSSVRKLSLGRAYLTDLPVYRSVELPPTPHPSLQLAGAVSVFEDLDAYPWQPVGDSSYADPFFASDIKRLIERGPVHGEVPVMIGLTRDDGLLVTAGRGYRASMHHRFDFW